MKKLTLILILVACGFTGCKRMQGAETTAKPSSADPKADVIAASRKLIALKSLSAIVDGTGGKLAIKKDVRYVAPDRYHIKFDDETGAHVEMINIGDDSYMKDGDSWNKLPGHDPASSTFRNSFTDEVLETISDAKFEGEETLNGKPASVYSYKIVTKVAGFPVAHRIWVDKKSGIPIKSVGEYNDSQVKTLTTTFDAEKPVTIDVPTVKK